MTTLRDRICLIVSELLESIMSHENRSKETIDALEALFAEERARIRKAVEALRHENDGSFGHESALLSTGHNSALDAVLSIIDQIEKAKQDTLKEVGAEIKAIEPFVDLTRDLSERKRAYKHIEKYRQKVLTLLSKLDKLNPTKENDHA